MYFLTFLYAISILVKLIIIQIKKIKLNKLEIEKKLVNRISKLNSKQEITRRSSPR